MVGVPHSTGCSLCRERHIKVSVDAIRCNEKSRREKKKNGEEKQKQKKPLFNYPSDENMLIC